MQVNSLTHKHHKTATTAAASSTDSYVEHADRYIRCPITAEDLDEKLGRLAHGHTALASPVAIDVGTGKVDLVSEADVKNRPNNKQVLPLRLGALRTSLEGIKKGDSWLLDRTPVYYFDVTGQVHIDFTNLAGFISDPMGHLIFRSVNPY